MSWALIGAGLACAAVLLSPAAATAAPAPTITEAALRAAVVDLRPDSTVLDLTLTTSSADGSLSDAASPQRRVVTLAADVLFAFGSADLTAAATSRLAEAAAAAAGSGGTLAVDGYTDSVGDPTSNLALSQQRASAVLTALEPQLVTATVTVAGHGEADPVAPNTNPDGTDNPAGRAANRRVTLTITP